MLAMVACLPACLYACECRGQQTARVYVRNTRIADGKHHVIVDKVGGTPFSLASKSRQSLDGGGVELNPPPPPYPAGHVCSSPSTWGGAT